MQNQALEEEEVTTSLSTSPSTIAQESPKTILSTPEGTINKALSQQIENIQQQEKKFLVPPNQDIRFDLIVEELEEQMERIEKVKKEKSVILAQSRNDLRLDSEGKYLFL